jgi:uncharacterized protein
MRKQVLFLSILFFSIFHLSCAQSDKKVDSKFPEPVGYVNDFEKLFTESQINELTEIIVNHANETTNQIALVTIDNYEPYETLFQYSYELAETWGVGQKDKNNGVVIVFGKKIREIRIMTGYGVEDLLKDEEAKFIIDSTIIPEFKKGDYFLGIKKGLLEIIEELE